MLKKSDFFFNNSKFFSVFLITFSLGFFSSCASDEKKADTAEEAYKIAQELDKDEHYKPAIQRYLDVKNKFPYSNLAIQSELAIADVHYKSEDYPEAQLAYQNFIELHPKHEKTDYALYRIGMSYFMQLDDSIDRDMSLANDAIYNFNEFIKKYPKSEFLAQVQEYRRKSFIKLNEKELYIADFYFKQKLFDSAILRYESSYSKYPDFGYEPRSLKGIISCAEKLNDSEKLKKYSAALINKFPDSAEAKQVKERGL